MPTKHRPTHIHPDNSIIFITARIYGGFSYLYPNETKVYFLNKLQSIKEKYKITIEGWIILNNHYHLLIRVKQGKLVAQFIKELHGSTAHYINKKRPSLITKQGQLMTKEIAPWDKRQSSRLNNLSEDLNRRLKSATTNKINIQKTRRTNKTTPAKITGETDPKSNSETHHKSNSETHHKSNSETHHKSNSEIYFAPEKKILLDFIKEHKSKLTEARYRGLKSAITKGVINDPQVIILHLAKNVPIWYQYVDTVMRSEKDYHTHLNYLHQNAVKHGYVKRMSDYKWSSVHTWIENKGKQWLLECFQNYPVTNFFPVGISE